MIELCLNTALNQHRHTTRVGYMQVCTSLQTDNHASTPPLSFFTGWMPFLPPNQQRQSTELAPTYVLTKQYTAYLVDTHVNHKRCCHAHCQQLTRRLVCYAHLSPRPRVLDS